jgi:hypothetical protein
MLKFALALGAAALMLTGMACGGAETPSRTPVATPGVTPGVTPSSPPAGESPDMTLGELFAGTDRYNGREILLLGFYFHGWESNLLSERMEASGLAEGHLWPQGQTIWLEGSIPTEVLERLRQQEMMGPLERYGKVRVKGKFEHGDRYGHLGGFDAQIVVSEMELLPWSPPSSAR